MTPDRPLLRRQHNLRLDGELEAVVGDDLAIGLAHRRLDHLRHCGLAVEPPEMRDRDFAGPETSELYASLQVVEPLIDPRLKIGRGDDHAKFALEASGGSFSHLHWHYSSRPEIEHISARFWEKPPGLVRAEGLEPPRLSSREPKSRASTNSATPATGGCFGGAAYYAGYA